MTDNVVPTEYVWYNSSISSPIITVKVSANTEITESTPVYNMHSKLLTDNSEFFAAALKEDRFIEGQLKKVELKETDPGIFQYFVEWLYRESWHGSLFQTSIPETKVPRLVKVYALTELLICSRMQSAVGEILQKHFDDSKHLYSDATVYDSLEVVATKLATGEKDPLGNQIIWLAVERLEKLHENQRFKTLLADHHGLALGVAMRAGHKQRPGGNPPAFGALGAFGISSQATTPSSQTKNSVL